MMRFKTGDKVFSNSLEYNLIIACREGESEYKCIKADYPITSVDQVKVFVVSDDDLSPGWKIDG